jgi:hypothetical protein
MLNLVYSLPSIREAHAIKKSLLALRTQIIGSHVHCLTDSLVAVQLSKKNIDKGGKLLHRIVAELDQFDVSFEHVKRDDQRIRVVDDLGRDPIPKKVVKKARYIEDHQSNGYYFRTFMTKEEIEIDCMIDTGSALSMMRLSMAEQAELEVVRLEEPKEFYGSHPSEQNGIYFGSLVPLRCASLYGRHDKRSGRLKRVGSQDVPITEITREAQNEN